MIRARVSSEAGRAKLDRMASAIREKGPRVVERVAFWTHQQLVTKTPKKWTGQTRRSWQTFRSGSGGYAVTSLSKVALFLELGTRAHGPVTAKALFIPLTRRAALGGGGLIYGRDYVLAKRVKGIAAMYTVRNQRGETKRELREQMITMLRGTLQ